ncbi:MAG: heme-binding domain-containing protein [Alistipes sp.]|nr:heme-binding domain-containing protein [Alistipes sp.]
MKKKLLSLVVIVAALLAAVYIYENRTPSAELSATERVVATLERGGCMSCHSSNPDLPFYATLPVAGAVVMQDVDSGYRAFDMAPMMEALKRGGRISPVDVAKVERVALDGRMPSPKYYLINWGSQMTSAKGEIIADWAEDYREAYYDDGLEGDMADEPLRPIALSLPVDKQKAALGKLLYHDVRLSVDNTVSCASCHGLNTAGVDNKQYSEGVGGQLGGVNAPTVFNAVYNFVQFWDGRAATLADQAAGPPLNPVEMASASFDEIIAKLRRDRQLTRAFTQVYPDGWSQANITDAIECFEMTLLTPNSRFDKYLRGDEDAITEEEKDGYELFKDYGCATCHVGPNVGGESYELMGLRKHYFADRGLPLTVEDNGRFKETGEERDRHRFKVPGLRNVALTWPYYHDGTRETLKEAVCNMGTYQVGVSLSDDEEDKILAFLHTLTGEYEGKPLTNENVQVAAEYDHD